MRISTAYQYDAYLSDIGRAFERTIEAQRQVATGKRFTKASEDWTGAASSLSLRTVKSAISQYRTNILDARTEVGFAESAFSEASDALKQAYAMAVQAANGPLDQAARNNIASQITQIQTRLVDLGNTKGPRGNYIFAGQMTDTAPFTAGSTGITFNGDTNQILIETGPGQTTAKNFVANTLFSDAYNALESFKTNLAGGNVGAISGVDIAALQSAGAAFRQIQGEAGIRLQGLERTDNDHVKRLDEIVQNLSDVEDVDLTEAAVQLQLTQTAYQAALTAASKGFNLSLLDFVSR